MANPVLIQGLPGLGFIGKIVVDYLIDQLKPSKFAEIYSSYISLPDGDVGVNVELDSTFSLPKYDFYAYRGNPNMIFLTGDTQPSPWGQYAVATNVLDFVEGFGCKTVIALGGYALQRPGRDIIYVVSNESSMVKDLQDKFDIRPAQSGMIKGAFGVMLGLGNGRNMKCLGFLGATVGRYPDLRASRNILRLLSNMFNLQINLREMDKRVEDMERRVKRFDEVRQIVPDREGQEGGVPQGYIS